MSIVGLHNYKSFFYDPESGRMFKEIKTVNYVVSRGLSQSNSIMLDGKSRQYTHIMYRAMSGRWPQLGMFVDHKDGNPENNRWSNLRESTPQQNSHNTQPWRSYKTELARGVTILPSGSFRVAMRVNGVTTHIGTFKTKEEANSIAIAKAKELHKEFAFENRPLNRRF